MKEILAQIDTCSKEISGQQPSIEEYIHATFRRLQEVLNARETELIGQLYQETQGKLKDLAVQKNHPIATVNNHMYFMKEKP